VKARYKCYVVAHINQNSMKVTGVDTYSEPPWSLTRHMVTRGGKFVREIMAIVLESEADSYHEAQEEAVRVYPLYEPDLAERFPINSRTPTIGG